MSQRRKKGRRKKDSKQIQNPCWLWGDTWHDSFCLLSLSAADVCQQDQVQVNCVNPHTNSSTLIVPWLLTAISTLDSPSGSAVQHTALTNSFVSNLTRIVTILWLLGLQRRWKSMNMAQSFRIRWIFITLKMKWPAVPKSAVSVGVVIIRTN